jgi:hypothetical protein
MHSDFIRRTRTYRLAALVLLALCFTQLPTRARQSSGGEIELQSFSLGLVHGQKARITVSNDDSARAIQVTLRIWDSNGNQLAQREVVIPPDGFRSMDVDRDDISLPGESPTGRLQMLVDVSLFLRDARPSGFSPATAELIDNSTGKTTVAHTIGLRHEHVRPE